MDTYRIVLRIIHVLGGDYWAGATFFMLALPQPDVSSLAADKLPQRVQRYNRAGMSGGLAAILTLIPGLLLYWRVTGGLSLSQITTGQGLTLTVGALAGISAFLIGALVIGQQDHKMVAIADDLEASGETPSPEQMDELRAAERTLSKGTLWASILLVIAVLAMASFQFVTF